MKNTYIFLTLFFSVSILKAQNFEKTFNLQNNDNVEYGYSGFELEDGKYLIGINNRLLCLAQNGDSLWSKVYPGYGSIEKIFKNDSNQVVLATNTGKMRFLKINTSNGSIISFHTPPSQLSNSGYTIIDVAVLPNGDFLNLFRSGGPDGGIIQRYTPGSSKVKWQNDYAGAGFKPSAILVEDTTFLLAGYCNTNDIWTYDFKVIKISLNNKPIWSKQFYRGLVSKDYTVGLVKNNLNQYLLASYLSFGDKQTTAPTILTLAQNGDSLALHTFNKYDTKNITQGLIYRIVPANNEFYATGSIMFTSKDSNNKDISFSRLAVYKINQKGEFLGANEFNNVGYFKSTNTTYQETGAWGNGCLVTKDGYCLAYGVGNQLFKGTPGWLAKSVFKGYVVKTNIFKSATSSIKKSKNPIQSLPIYPNPAKDFFQFNSITSGNLTIIDINGKLMLNQALFSGLNTIHINKIKSGIYFIKTNHTINSTIFIKD